MDIIRLDNDHYRVRGLVVTRQDNGWAAIPHDGSLSALFTTPTLDEAFDLAAQACEMFAPVSS